MTELEESYLNGKKAFGKGQFAESIDFFNQAIELDDKHAKSWVDKSISLYKLGRFQEAQDCLETADKIDPESHYVQYAKRDFGQLIQNGIRSAAGEAPAYGGSWDEALSGGAFSGAVAGVLGSIFGKEVVVLAMFVLFIIALPTGSKKFISALVMVIVASFVFYLLSSGIDMIFR